MLSIHNVKSKKEMIQFIKFPMGLYKGSQYYVPPIVSFELSTLDRKKNPAFEHCEAEYWLAKQENVIVGRIAGIIHSQEVKEKKLARFGWIDFIDDLSVSTALLNAVSQWALSKGATRLHGPLGFTDLDFEGALIEGFEERATQATIYNFPYYIDHYNQLGFSKAADWVEVRGAIPADVPRKLKKTASIVSTRFKLRALHFKSNKEVLKYAPDVFHVLNKAYSHLYGYYPLSENQIKYYVKQYFGFIRKDYVSIIVNEKDKVVAMAISLPSMSGAFQKAKGSLFPFGFIHVLKSFYSNQHLDLFLIGVDPEYQRLGASAIIFDELISAYIKKGVQTISTGPMLENNAGVQNLWNDFTDIKTVPIRRRCYTKEIEIS